MYPARRSKAWTHRWIALPGLSLALGCAAPRAQLNAPLVSLSAPSLGSSGRSAVSPRLSRRGLSWPARIFGRQDADPAAPLSLPDGVDERVARYVREPEELFDPAAPMRRWQYIVLHHSAADTGSLASIDRYHRETKGWDECGYHFVIGNGTESGDGEIEVGGRWVKQKHGAHCKHPDHPEYNERGIGICLVGDFNHGQPSPKQVEACRRLVLYLERSCGVSPTRVTTHGDLTGNRTECPGHRFPIDRILGESRLTWR